MRHKIRLRLTALLFAIGVCAVASPASATKFPPVFRHAGDAVKVPASHLSKWQGVLRRHASEAARPEECTPDLFTRCPRASWQEILVPGPTESNTTQKARRVNHEVNQARYITDSRNWGRTDYWATPLQLFDRGGDCEDYAIAKYLALRALGVPTERMFVVVVQDRRRGLPHAVLAIAHGGHDMLVLDNTADTLLDARDSAHYQPVYAVNEHIAYVFQDSPAYKALQLSSLN